MMEQLELPFVCGLRKKYEVKLKELQVLQARELGAARSSLSGLMRQFDREDNKKRKSMYKNLRIDSNYYIYWGV